jgi:hypothetical protein
MMVNGNVGTGVAVARAFSLVRVPLRPRLGQRDRRHLPGHGHRPDHRHGYLSYAFLCAILLAFASAPV